MKKRGEEMAYLKNILYILFLFLPAIIFVCLSLIYLLKEPLCGFSMLLVILFLNILSLVISPFIMFFLLIIGAYFIFVTFKIK